MLAISPSPYMGVKNLSNDALHMFSPSHTLNSLYSASTSIDIYLFITATVVIMYIAIFPKNVFPFSLFYFTSPACWSSQPKIFSVLCNHTCNPVHVTIKISECCL